MKSEEAEKKAERISKTNKDMTEALEKVLAKMSFPGTARLTSVYYRKGYFYYKITYRVSAKKLGFNGGKKTFIATISGRVEDTTKKSADVCRKAKRHLINTAKLTLSTKGA